MNRTTIILATFALVTATFACGSASNPAGAAAPTSATAGMGALDGKSYEVTLSIAGEPPQKDTLVFDGGKFESTSCTGVGFPRWTEYTASGDPRAIAFHVVTHHPSGGSIDWNGVVRSDSIEGRGARTMNGKTDLGNFSGSLNR
jgi:hypothetical protein